MTRRANRGERGKRRKRIAIALCGLFFVGAAWMLFQYRSDIAQQWDRISTDSLIAETPCGPIEYAVIGSGAPILVIHGAGGGFDQGLDFARGLTRRSFKAIAMSRFGYLRTPLPNDASAEAQADAHLCLMNALGIERAAMPRYELEHIQAPTLVISVKDDRFGTYAAARYTADHIAGARFVGYEEGGHLGVGHNQEILDEAASFFQEHR